MVASQPVDPFAAQLEALESSAQVAIVSLQAETDNAQRVLADINTRVELGQIGAELVAPLTTAVEQAQATLAELQQTLNDIRQQREVIA